MQSRVGKHQKNLGIVGALLALTIAAVYLGATPEAASRASGLQRIILLYGHATSWVFLSVMSVILGLRGSNKWSRAAAYAALISYAVFMSTLFLVR